MWAWRRPSRLWINYKPSWGSKTGVIIPALVRLAVVETTSTLLRDRVASQSSIMHIHVLGARELRRFLPQLISLLQDAVAGGASIGFLPPLSEHDARAYWDEVAAALKGRFRILLIAEEDGAVVGTVQLDMASRANGLHRAEVAKLMVHSAHRRRGIAAELMQAVENAARHAGRTTLILDTREGDPSERLYLKLGYRRAGTIPEYARSADGTLDATVFMYKLLH